MKKILLICVLLICVIFMFWLYKKHQAAQRAVTDIMSTNETLAGIDADNNGIRDDVQAYINQTYPNSEMLRMALDNVAQQMQKAIVSPTSTTETDLTASGDCLDYVASLKGKNFSAIYDPLMNLQLNTFERFKAYGEIPVKTYILGETQEKYHGCPIDPASFKN